MSDPSRMVDREEVLATIGNLSRAAASHLQQPFTVFMDSPMIEVVLEAYPDGVVFVPGIGPVQVKACMKYAEPKKVRPEELWRPTKKRGKRS